MSSLHEKQSNIIYYVSVYTSLQVILRSVHREVTVFQLVINPILKRL